MTTYSAISPSCHSFDLLVISSTLGPPGLCHRFGHRAGHLIPSQTRFVHERGWDSNHPYYTQIWSKRCVDSSSCSLSKRSKKRGINLFRYITNSGCKFIWIHFSALGERLMLDLAIGYGNAVEWMDQRSGQRGTSKKGSSCLQPTPRVNISVQCARKIIPSTCWINYIASQKNEQEHTKLKHDLLNTCQIPPNHFSKLSAPLLCWDYI